MPSGARARCPGLTTPVPWADKVDEGFALYANESKRDLLALRPFSLSTLCKPLSGLQRGSFVAWGQTRTALQENMLSLHVWYGFLVGSEAAAADRLANDMSTEVLSLSSLSALHAHVRTVKAQHRGHEFIQLLLIALDEHFIPPSELKLGAQVRDEEWRPGMSAFQLFVQLEQRARDLHQQDSLLRDFGHIVERTAGKEPHKNPSEPTPSYRVLLHVKQKFAANIGTFASAGALRVALEVDDLCMHPLPTQKRV